MPWWDGKIFDNEEIEVENEFSSLITKERFYWRYILNTACLKNIHNITVLFRGDDSEIRSSLGYGVLLANGKVIDSLENNDEDDIRVMGFNSFLRTCSLKCRKEVNYEIILVFKEEHEYESDKIRIIADAEGGEESGDFSCETKFGEIEMIDDVISISGPEWCEEFPSSLIDEEIDIQTKQGEAIFLQDPKEDVFFDNDSLKYGIFSYLDDIVAWKAQRNLLRMLSCRE